MSESIRPEGRRAPNVHDVTGESSEAAHLNKKYRFGVRRTWTPEDAVDLALCVTRFLQEGELTFVATFPHFMILQKRLEKFGVSLHINHSRKKLKEAANTKPTTKARLTVKSAASRN